MIRKKPENIIPSSLLKKRKLLVKQKKMIIVNFLRLKRGSAHLHLPCFLLCFYGFKLGEGADLAFICWLCVPWATF